MLLLKSFRRASKFLPLVLRAQAVFQNNRSAIENTEFNTETRMF